MQYFKFKMQQFKYTHPVLDHKNHHFSGEESSFLRRRIVISQAKNRHFLLKNLHFYIKKTHLEALLVDRARVGNTLHFIALLQRDLGGMLTQSDCKQDTTNPSGVYGNQQ